jgi:hypothetical protein
MITMPGRIEKLYEKPKPEYMISSWDLNKVHPECE